jgi:hypothetical protein
MEELKDLMEKLLVKIDLIQEEIVILHKKTEVFIEILKLFSKRT